MGNYRDMPQDIEIERSVLGAMLGDPLAVDKGIETLSADDFYVPGHRRIFTAIVELVKKSRPVDLLSVCDEIHKSGDLDKIGGRSYVSSLMQSIVTGGNVEYHIGVIRDKAKLRNFIMIAENGISSAYSQEGDASEILDSTAQEILDVSEGLQEDGFIAISDVLGKVYDDVEEARRGNSMVTGATYGFKDMNKFTGGMHKGEYIIIAARPSVGKSGLALSIAINYALETGKGVAIFSPEMNREQICMRVLARAGNCNLQRLRTGTLSKADFLNLGKNLGKFNLPIYIDDGRDHTVLSLRSRARRLKREHDIGIVIVDYIQLLSSGKKTENNNLEVGAISKGLNRMAGDLEIPVIALSQLNRNIENRPDKRPVLADLRDSGSLEQDADTVWFIQRPERYGINTIKIAGQEYDSHGVAELILAKQRNGSPGSAFLVFDAEIAGFKDMSMTEMARRGGDVDEPFAYKDKYDMPEM